MQLGLVGGDAASGPFHPDASTPGLEGLNWLKMSIAVSEPDKGVSAIGFIVDGRDDQDTKDGGIWVMFSDSTELKIDYAPFGPGAGSGLFFGYQAPAGKYITGIECTRRNTSGNSFLALDDLTFVLVDKSQAIPPAAITDLAASSPTEDSVTLTWTAPGDSGNTGTAASYDIRYSTAAITEANWAAATQVTGEPAPAVGGHQPGDGRHGAERLHGLLLRDQDHEPGRAGLAAVQCAEHPDGGQHQRHDAAGCGDEPDDQQRLVHHHDAELDRADRPELAMHGV